jgi:hypothetical protein
MNRVCLVVVAACAAACSAVSKKADELVTVSVGADSLSAVQIERSMVLGPAKLPACLDLSITLPSSNTTVAMQNTDAGCTLSLQQPGLTLFDQQEIENARDQVGPFDVDGVRSGKVSLEKLELWGPDGAPLSLSQYVSAISVQIDRQVLLDKSPTSSLLLQGDAKLTSQVPDSVIDKLKSAVKSGQPATADVSITLWLQAQTLTDLPGALKLNLVLQPELEVNLVDAL